MKKRSAGIFAILLLFLAIIFGVDPFGLLANDAPEVITVTPIVSEVVVVPQPSDNITTVIVKPADWYQIFFTDPTCPPEEERVGGIDEEVAAGIAAAQTSVDVAAFDLESPAIVNALIDLEKQGIPVRVVTDTDNATLSSINRLRRNGISVVEDNRSALMHNKFVIIDERYVWIGSMNLASNDVYCHNNNFVQFDLPLLAANYTAEMDEMYIDRSFGPTSPDDTPHEQITQAGVRLENYFASEKKAATIMAEAINRAQSEILFMAFSFTNDEIGEAMLAQAEAGVTVRGVFETVGADTEYSYFPVMREAGLPSLEVRLDGNSYMMHHKVIILDRETVIFGSFNFSDSANRQNDENIVIIHDAAFAAYFVEEFEAVWAEAKTP
ncbi:MAG: phospholipase D-like domain-containing protein [Candidatus Promineifilaceae bacterium]